MISPDQMAQHAGHETEQAEEAYTSRLSRDTAGLPVDPVHAARVTAWLKAKNQDIVFSDDELEVVDLSFLLEAICSS